MKKVCFIVTSPMFITSFLEQPIRALAKENKVYVICNQATHPVKINLKQVEKIYSVNIQRNISIIHDIRTLIDLIKILRNEQFDVVHTLTPKAGLLGILAAFISRIPNRIHTFTGQIWATKKGGFRYLLQLFDRLVIGLSTHVMVDGKAQEEYLVNERILRPKKAIVLHNVSTAGVDTEKFKPNTGVREKIRANYNLNEKDTIFMFLGRLTNEKGINELIHAFLSVHQEYPHSKLFLVGPNEMTTIPESNLDELPIIYLPFTEHPEQILQLCDVFCFPSHREGFGYSVVEASSTEKPIICSDIYGLNYTCIDGVTGLKHVPLSHKSLKEKMTYALEHPQKMIKMGENGRKYVEEHFLMRDVVDAWLRFYNVL